MIDFELEELKDVPEWQTVVQAYATEHSTAKRRDAEFDGWIPRIKSVAGVKDEYLPKLHGKLIAIGYLKFQLAGRLTGMRYQLTPQGKQAVGQQTDSPENRESTHSETPNVV